MKKALFKQEDIEVVCPQKMVWDEMEVVSEGKRLCEGCDKVLVDVTGYTKEQVHELQKKDPSVCVAVTNALLVSSLSFSLLSAGGDIENNLSSAYIIEPVLVEIEPPVTLGLPARIIKPSLPICNETTVCLNAIKRFFGFEEDTTCIEKEDD